MATKLVVSMDGLSIGNITSVVSSRSIDEVILVNSSSGFNSLDSTARTAITTAKSSLESAGATLSVAFANESSAVLSGTGNDNFYNFLNANSLNFFNDPGLESLTSSLVLESSGVSNGSIVSSSLSAFDTASINNSLYVDGTYNSSELTLGSDFGSKPTLSISSADYLSDLSSSIVISISASDFSNILASNSSTSDGTVALTDPSNLIVAEDTSSSSSLQTFLSPTVSGWSHVSPNTFVTAYDGTNRIGNLNTLDASRTTPGTQTQNAHWIDATGSDVELSVIQSLRLPLMGIAPHLTMSDSIVLKDTAENLSAGLKTFTEGQLASFNKIIASDDGTLVVDSSTFKLLDTAQQTATWSTMNGLSVLDTSGNNLPIKVTGSYSDFIDNGLYSSSGGFVSELANNAGANLVSQISQYFLSGTVTSSTDVTNVSNFINSAPTGVTVSTDISISSSLINSNASGNLTTSEFISIAQLDGLVTSTNILAESYSSGLSIVDTADNIKALLTNTSSDIVAAKDYIASISSITDGDEKINLTWDEYIGALSGANFSKTDSSTWSTLTSEIALKNLGNIEIVVSGTALELKTLIDTYGTTLTNYSSGLTFKVTDGGELVVSSAVLDILMRELIVLSQLLEIVLI